MNKIDKYFKKLKIYLKLDNKAKNRIIADLKSDALYSLENGKSPDEILIELGSPKALANQYNSEFSSCDNYKIIRNLRALKIITVLIGIFIISFAILSMIICKHNIDTTSISNIGGADGPANIYVSSENINFWYYIRHINKFIFLPIGLFVVSLISYIILKNKGVNYKTTI